jgi:Tol biopolymer transport system component
VYVRDRLRGTTELVSVGPDGRGAGGFFPSISADGRFVAFWSFATNLVADDTNGSADVFVYDRETSTIVRASVDSSDAQASNHSFFPALSADGRFVAFESSAPDLVAGDGNGFSDVFIRDLEGGTTERVSVDSSGAESDGDSGLAAISGDGRFVAFESVATNLVANDANGKRDIFVRDRDSGTTAIASVDSSGNEGDGDSRAAAISSDGRFVAFESAATNLVAGDTNGKHDVFVHDRDDGTTVRVSVDSAGDQADGDSFNPSISADGALVAFVSSSPHLVPDDTNGSDDVFLRDRTATTTERLSVDSAGLQSNGQSADAWISADGSRIAFGSTATNLVQDDTNGAWDVFVRERAGGTSFTSLCDPGSGGVMSCPCENPPSGPGRGCDNSSGTGGAVLAASGATSLSSDSLVFTTSGERDSALSVVMQGNAGVAGGVVMGQGVRCLGGTIIRRLFSGNASNGSIRLPDFEAGDPTVSKRSAERGDEIKAGESRWYLVYYRDPIVLGGCPASSTFNATQTLRIAWSL